MQTSEFITRRDERMEKYSVLMSVYIKVEKEELKLSVDSMLRQTAKPEQIVIVLDGDVKEDVSELISDYCNKYPDVFTIVPLEDNHGLAYALNEGIKNCRNELICRMDADDVSVSDRCEAQLKEFEKESELTLLGGHSRHFKDSPENLTDLYGKQPIGEDAIKKCIRRGSAFSHPTVMFKKSSVLACGGYDPVLRRSQDHDLFTKMLAKGMKCENIDKVLILFRADDDCKLRNRNKESLKARVIIQKRIFKRKQCSLIDYLYVRLGVFAMKILPDKLYLKIYSIIRENQ